MHRFMWYFTVLLDMSHIEMCRILMVLRTVLVLIENQVSGDTRLKIVVSESPNLDPAASTDEEYIQYKGKVITCDFRTA